MTTLVLACRRGQGSDWWKHLWIAVSVVSRRRNLPTLRQERFLLPAESCASWYMAPVRLVKINTSWVFRKCCSPCCSAHVTLLTLYLHALYDACVSSTALTLCEWSPTSYYDFSLITAQTHVLYRLHQQSAPCCLLVALDKGPHFVLIGCPGKAHTVLIGCPGKAHTQLTPSGR